MKPAYACRYRIGASMTHLGGPHGGHFLCEERANNVQLQHSDATISPLPKEDFGTRGYFIRLDRVEKRKLVES